MYKFKSYINGKFIDSVNKLEIIGPKDNAIVGVVSTLSPKMISEAFAHAKLSFSSWRKLSSSKRITYVQKFKNLLNERKNELAKIMFLENAKEMSDAISEINRTIEYIEKTTIAFDKIKTRQMIIGGKTNDIHLVPLGVVLAISPFNYSVNLSMSKIAPGLIAGNTIVFKPATNGTLVGGFLATLMHEAGIPKGVFNLVTGRGRDIGDVLISNPNIDMISFTGSVRVGKNITKAQSMIPLVLELGGNDAGYVRHDADLDNAAKEIAKGAFSYSGQRCTAIKRVILHKDVKDEFIKKLLIAVSKMKTNPLITSHAKDYVEELILDSKTKGDKFILEGKTNVNDVPFHIVETDASSRAWKEEAFGPLLPIIVIDDEKDLINIFNQTNFGLQNSVFTKDIAFAKELALDLESGSVNINRSSSRGPDEFPFLGVKDSGFGTQGIESALFSMTRELNVINNK
ncbi:aldehyde dehydrogenase family protein [Candidatus Mycoplasma mahonii]|uniref:aldehyde dehydrogenase family protein n=1 Tax=Candidatus Mycoplasma mahonii TaxID=3004105 RepID=UPI0026EAE464|nr:aldehyde dehydrogenase family protein [Candidatus Mycoplasma mahonii]WKX02386.1 aldehyde dehydrogenase family protein [Candidatus Mycoplasma mahonii]